MLILVVLELQLQQPKRALKEAMRNWSISLRVLGGLGVLKIMQNTPQLKEDRTRNTAEPNQHRFFPIAGYQQHNLGLAGAFGP